jgi:hypothetical protein
VKVTFKIVLQHFARITDDSPTSMVGLNIGVRFFIAEGLKLANFNVENFSWSSENSE